ncbi:MAG: hypothetical protein G01um101433_631 [Parcubacteria group bacterium Gr01-1014_33]|nr:MAG: hypothetical protein G01um101433_631 [Parcubacteria group bacterium Gr01-1014_33]
MKIIIGCISVLAALLIDWSALQGTAFGVPFSLAGLAVIFWFWDISFSARLWISFFFGILMDTFSLLPFGIYTAVFFLISFFPEFTNSIFFSVDARISRAAGAGLGYVSFSLLVFSLGQLAQNAGIV